MHVGAGCFANRASTFFGDGSVPDDADMADPRHLPTDLPGSADEAIAFLERTYRQWHTGISSLDEEGLRTPLGRKGGRYAKDPMAALIVHINREVMHHGAEIGLLRDLYRATGSTTRDSRLLPRPDRAAGRAAGYRADARAGERLGPGPLTDLVLHGGRQQPGPGPGHVPHAVRAHPRAARRGGVRRGRRCRTTPVPRAG